LGSTPSGNAGPHRHVVLRHVGDLGQRCRQRRTAVALFGLERRTLGLEARHFGLEAIRGSAILARHRLADLLGDGVATLLHGLETQDR